MYAMTNIKVMTMKVLAKLTRSVSDRHTYAWHQFKANYNTMYK